MLSYLSLPRFPVSLWRVKKGYKNERHEVTPIKDNDTEKEDVTD